MQSLPSWDPDWHGIRGWVDSLSQDRGGKTRESLEVTDSSGVLECTGILQGQDGAACHPGFVK